MPPKVPEKMGGIRMRSFGDGGLDNKGAQNTGYASDKGGSDGGMENKKIKQYGRHEGGSYARAKVNARPNSDGTR